jgi:hypothetical protein
LKFRFVHFYPSQLLISSRSKAAFPLLVCLTNICYLCVLATSWKLCTCIDTGHLSLSVNVTQVELTADCVLTKSRLVAIPWRVYTWQADRWRMDSRVSWPSTSVVGTQSPGKQLASVPHYECLPNKPVMETVWQLCNWFLAECRVTGACQIHQSWERGFTSTSIVLTYWQLCNHKRDMPCPVKKMSCRFVRLCSGTSEGKNTPLIRLEALITLY